MTMDQESEGRPPGANESSDLPPTKDIAEETESAGEAFGTGSADAGSTGPASPSAAEREKLPTVSEDGEPALRPSDVPQIEGYEITGRLGEGGMGVVWRARQLGTNRQVALKLLGPGRFGSERSRMRFEREVELAARLEHPNIARIYESGLHHRVYYYAMELVEGVHLDEYVKEHSLAQQQVLQLMQPVCQGVQHAHQRGVIHRDLKPSNILVTPDGRPHVVDFGLARGLWEEDRRHAISLDGEAAGTPAYMSPKQAAGKVDELDTRTDVYSLGVILYELLTGQLPRDMTGTTLELLRRIADEEIRRPREVTKEIHKELEALLLKALAREPNLRYTSAGELAQDLENYLTGEPLIARKPTTLYFLRKRMWKHRLPLIGAAALLLGIIVAIIFYIHSIKTEQGHTHEARVRAEGQRQLATEQRDLATEMLDRLVFEVQRELSGGLGQIRLRQRLLDIPKKVLDRLADSAKGWDIRADRTAAAALLLDGDIALLAGRAAEARRAYDQALERFKMLAEARAHDEQSERDLCVLHTRLGQACQRMGDKEAARTHLQSALARVEQLMKVHPHDRGLLRSQWALRISLGDVDLDDAAEAAYRQFKEALAIAELLAGPGAGGAGAQRDLSVSHKRLGDASLSLNRLPEALAHYGRALKIDRALVAAEPEDLAAERSLSVSLGKMAEAYLKAGQRIDARAHCQESLRRLKALETKDPDRFQTKADQAAILFMLGEIERADGKSAEAAQYYRRSVAILRQLREAGTLEHQPKYRELLERVEGRLQTSQSPTSPPPE